MELLEIKEHISLETPATYELSVKMNDELMGASFDTRKRIDFYEAFIEALSSNIYSFKKEHYPNDDISFYIKSGNFFAYNESIQKKYLEIFQALNYKTDDIIEQARNAFSYSDKDKMKNCIHDFVYHHFNNHELEKQNNANKTPRVRLFTLYEDEMQGMYHIRVKINEKEIIDNSNVSVLMRFDDFFQKALSKNLYEYQASYFPNEKMTFSIQSGTMFTYSQQAHSTYLNLLNHLNKQSYEILTTLKNMDSIFNNKTQNYLETYIAQQFLKSELEEKNTDTKTRKIKV
jgi:hypothetical protein